MVQLTIHLFQAWCPNFKSNFEILPASKASIVVLQMGGHWHCFPKCPAKCMVFNMPLIMDFIPITFFSPGFMHQLTPFSMVQSVT